MCIIYNLKNNKDLRKTLRHNATEEEYKLWMYLKEKRLGYKFRRQTGIGKYIIDFYCPKKKLAIELDGSQHLEERNSYDTERTIYLNSLGIEVLRIWNNGVHNNIGGVIEVIVDRLKTI
jgi:very-short-patch-repair endonuclease